MRPSRGSQLNYNNQRGQNNSHSHQSNGNQESESSLSNLIRQSRQFDMMNTAKPQRRNHQDNYNTQQPQPHAKQSSSLTPRQVGEFSAMRHGQQQYQPKNVVYHGQHKPDSRGISGNGKSNNENEYQTHQGNPGQSLEYAYQKSSTPQMR